MHRWLISISIASVALGGCVVQSSSDDDDGGGGTGGTGGTATTPSSSSAGGSGGSGGAATGGGGSTAEGWTTSTHPCAGNRTDALHVDDDGTTWVGCGTTTVGFGLYSSPDGLSGWTAPTTTPGQFFEQMRVNSIQRASDGLLYVGGTTNGGPSVVAIDTTEATMEVVTTLVPGTLADNSFTVGTFRRQPDGSAIAESLTGNGMLYRPSDAVGSDPATWVNAYDWVNGGTSSLQILDLEIHDGGFYGVGATIADTPKVYLPDPQAAEPWMMQVVELGTYDGEMWSLAVAPDGRVVVGGVDQNADQGMIYVSDVAQESFTEFDLGTLEPDRSTWIRGVCIDGTTVVAVGEFSQTSDPLLLVSDDQGATFVDRTPEEAAGPLSQCVVRPGGVIVVAGEGGFIGRYQP